MSITDYLKKIRDNAWNTAQLGREFERFVKKFLKTDPVYAQQFDEVWLWGECPFAKGNDVATTDNWTSHASEAIVGQQIPVSRIGLEYIQNAAIDWQKFFDGGKKVVVKKDLRPCRKAGTSSRDSNTSGMTRSRRDSSERCSER